METLPVAEIERLDPLLDLFEDDPQVDPLLLERGLHPPLPISQGVLVWGFALCRLARRLGLGRLPCRRLPPAPGAEMLGTALRLEARAGRYSWGEKEKMLRFAQRRRAAGDPVDLGALSLWIEGREDPQLESRVERYAGLPPGIKAAVAAGRLDLKAAALAADLPPAVLPLLEGSRLSFSQRRQFLLMLREVRDRPGGADPASLVERLLREEDPLGALSALRFPALTGLRARFAALGQALWKGSGVRIEPPPYFEGERFTVELHFSSPDNLRRKLRVLRRVAEHADELLELLR